MLVIVEGLNNEEVEELIGILERIPGATYSSTKINEDKYRLQIGGIDHNQYFALVAPELDVNRVIADSRR